MKKEAGELLDLMSYFTPPTEKEAAEALDELNPKNDWLRRYIAYSAMLTTAPSIYHLGVGLSPLSHTAPHSSVPYCGSDLPSNIKSLVVPEKLLTKRT